jgi:hypothetical protein
MFFGMNPRLYSSKSSLSTVKLKQFFTSGQFSLSSNCLRFAITEQKWKNYYYSTAAGSNDSKFTRAIGDKPVFVPEGEGQ